jgi:D-3-phosphoglycerate dehydrogenase
MKNDVTIVFPDAGPGTEAIFQGPLRERMEKIGRLVIHESEPDSDAEFIDRIGDAQAVILGWRLSAEVLRAAKNLKVVAFTGIGVGDNVDIDLARSLGITVCNTPGYADITVAEHTMALMLAAARNIATSDREMREGAWNQSRSGFDLHGKKLGILGTGGIGARVASLAKAFGMDVLAWTANPNSDRAAALGLAYTDLNTIFAESDVVSLHLALTPETEGMVTADHLRRMRDGALLVNTARGGLVAEDALMTELSSGRISAALDVYHREPLPADHPIRSLPNVTLTPHTGYNTPEALVGIYTLAVTAIEGHFDGKPVNIVN